MPNIPNVANILLFNFCEQKFVQHDPITVAIDCNGLGSLIFKEKWPNYASGPKFAPNSDLFWVRRLFYDACGFSVPRMQQFCLFTCPPRSKWSSSEKMIFFLIFCKSIACPLPSVYTTIFLRRKDKTNYLSNQAWTKCYISLVEKKR